MYTFREKSAMPIWSRNEKCDSFVKDCPVQFLSLVLVAGYLRHQFPDTLGLLVCNDLGLK